MPTRRSSTESSSPPAGVAGSGRLGMRAWISARAASAARRRASASSRRADSSLRPARTRSRSSAGGLGDLPAAALLLGPQGIDLGDQAAAFGVGLQQPVDLVGDAGAALGQGRLDPLGVVTHELQIQHALRLPDRRDQIRVVAPMARVMAARSSSERLWSQRPPRTGLA